MMKRAGGYYNAGPFTPFMFKDLDAPPKSTLQTPGGTGGVNWGGTATDPELGYIFVKSKDEPSTRSEIRQVRRMTKNSYP
jgi:quinoprotein glucose dehydrogenase